MGTPSITSIMISVDFDQLRACSHHDLPHPLANLGISALIEMKNPAQETMVKKIIGKMTRTMRRSQFRVTSRTMDDSAAETET
jgi:hypothetical protein